MTLFQIIGGMGKFLLSFFDYRSIVKKKTKSGHWKDM